MLRTVSLSILLIFIAVSQAIAQFPQNAAEARKNVERVFREMEEFVKLSPGDPKLSVEISKVVWSWRFAIRQGAREFGITLSSVQEKTRKDLEHAAFERSAEHALKEFKDYIDCKPTRFVSKSPLGWNVYSEALHSQTELVVRLVEALETPNADRISRDYESLRTDWYKKFVVMGSTHFFAGTRKYKDVCGE